MNTELNPEGNQKANPALYTGIDYANRLQSSSTNNELEEDQSPPSKDVKTRTVDAARERFVVSTKPQSSLPLKERYHFKDWITVMTSSHFRLYSRIIKAEIRAALRLVKIKRHDDHVLACLDVLKENFHNYLLRLQDK